MEKITYTNTMPYTYEPSRKGAKFLIGERYKNNGEFLESVTKYHRGLDYMVNPNTSYADGSDIESLNASVKSSGCSLASVYGNSFDTILETYFANVHSNLWIYVTIANEEVTEYHMNENEFYMFIKAWGVLAKESGSQLLKIRLKKESHKMLTWLEERV